MRVQQLWRLMPAKHALEHIAVNPQILEAFQLSCSSFAHFGCLDAAGWIVDSSCAIVAASPAMLDRRVVTRLVSSYNVKVSMQAAQQGPPSYLLFQIPRADIFNYKSIYTLKQTQLHQSDEAPTSKKILVQLSLKLKSVFTKLLRELNKNNQSSICQIMAKGEIIAGYDPASIKLYSKCARDHAARNSAKKTERISSKANKSSIIAFQETKRPKRTLCTFEMPQSREQREKKYQPTFTPAVGQYNPKVQLDKPKLTWDILKIYSKRGNSKRIPPNSTEHREEKAKHRQGQTEKNEQDAQDINHSQIHTEFSVSLSPAKNIEAKFKKEGLNHSDVRKKTKTQKEINNGQSRVYTTIKSQVDMSKMVGRKQTNTNRYNNETSTQVDMSRSIDFVKPKVNKKYSFKQQVSRDKANEALGKPLIIAADYSYDYQTVKPKKTAYLCFSKSVGRKNMQKSATLNPPYSYTHYDFDGYVWNGRSNVFSNTKTHMMDFKKQTNRSMMGR